MTNLNNLFSKDKQTSSPSSSNTPPQPGVPMYTKPKNHHQDCMCRPCYLYKKYTTTGLQPETAISNYFLNTSSQATVTGIVITCPNCKTDIKVPTRQTNAHAYGGFGYGFVKPGQHRDGGERGQGNMSMGMVTGVVVTCPKCRTDIKVPSNISGGSYNHGHHYGNYFPVHGPHCGGSGDGEGS